MSKAILTLALLMGIGVTSVAAPVPTPKDKPAAKASNYFPCELGTKWEYECGTSGLVIEVTKVRHEKDCKIATFTHTHVESGRRSSVRYRVTKDAVYLEQVDPTATYEFLFLKLPLQVNLKWANEGKLIPNRGMYSEVRGSETVKVQAGEFKVFNVVTLLKDVPETDLKLHDQFADGIGKVKEFSSTPGNPPIVLKKFTPPPH